MTDFTENEFVDIYQDAIYELNAEILFSVSYTETKKDFYTFNKQINNNNKFEINLNDNTKKREVIEIFKKFFKNKEGNFNEKLNFFKEKIYDKKKEEIINFINLYNFE